MANEYFYHISYNHGNTEPTCFSIYSTFHQASEWLPPYQYHKVERSLVCVEGRGRISRSGVTQDIKLGSCVFQCDVPHQWIAQQQVDPVSVYCDMVGCHVQHLRHGISVW